MVGHASPPATTRSPLALPTTDSLNDKGEHVFLPKVADDRFGVVGLRQYLFPIPS